MTSKEQAVAEDDISQNGEVEEQGAQDEVSLDELLKEYSESEPKPETPSTQPDAAKDLMQELVAVKNEVSDLRQERAAERTDAAVGEAVGVFKAGLGEGSGFSDDAIRVILHGYAATNPKFATAFEERGQNPAGWTKVLGAAAKEWREKLASQPDPNVTEDTNALREATRKSSTNTSSDDGPDAKQILEMSDKDFRNLAAKLGAEV